MMRFILIAALLGLSVQGPATGSGKSGAPGSTGNIYTVTSVEYVTLPTGSGNATFAQYKMSVSPGTGGGAVVSGKACNEDVSKCVAGVGSGHSACVLVKTSDPTCKQKMANCSSVCVKFRNGDGTCVDIPTFLCMLEVQSASLAAVATPPETTPNYGTIGAEVSTFRLAAIGAVDLGPGGGSSGTTGSLPPQPQVFKKYTGDAIVKPKLHWTSPTGIAVEATFPPQGIHVVDGEGYFDLDLTGAPANARVSFETISASAWTDQNGLAVDADGNALGMDKGVSSFDIQ